MDWDSELYLKFMKQRTQPAIDLAGRLKSYDIHNIIDIGCGPGNSTSVLKKAFPDADITGIDSSPDMIDKATSTYNNINFRCLDASCDLSQLKEKYDLVFSNACIQWISDHKTLLTNFMALLNDDGHLAVQIPVNYKEPIHTIILGLANSPEWKAKIGNQRSLYNYTESEYHDILASISSDFTMWKTTYFHRMPSYESILEWYKGTGLRPYLDVLNEGDRQLFCNEVLEEVKKSYKLQANNEIIFRFPRLFFIAAK